MKHPTGGTTNAAIERDGTFSLLMRNVYEPRDADQAAY